MMKEWGEGRSAHGPITRSTRIVDLLVIAAALGMIAALFGPPIYHLLAG